VEGATENAATVQALLDNLVSRGLLNRFTRLHLIIPSKLNIVGAGLENSPLVAIGHNQWIAWTHTVSTASRFGMFELTLDPKRSYRLTSMRASRSR
jgi:acyl-homoserine lactone acylase PvdQ